MFTVAIIGRPNVGKSTLFNRLVGKRLALVDDTPGVTRDRRFADGSIAGLEFQVIDTAGLEQGDEESLQGRMWEQTQAAIEEADVCLFLIDSRTGILPDDRTFGQILRKAECPVILVANKMEGKPGEAGYFDAFSLGFGEPVPISAEHGQGMADLHDAILYTSQNDLIGKLHAITQGKAALPALQSIAKPYSWPKIIGQYDQEFESLTYIN